VPRLTSILERAVASRDHWMAGDAARWLLLAGRPPEVPIDLPAPYRLIQQGEWPAAGDEWERLGDPFQAAVARLHADDPTVVRDAHDALLRLGASPVAAIAARRLAMLGAPVPRGPRQTTEAHPAGLTVREAEVAGLMAEGLSNREIARRLVVSERTVGHHASAVLAKLAVRRRAEVAHALGRAVGA
jgi:DNA-binding CsgD family transcriptional regulator